MEDDDGKYSENRSRLRKPLLIMYIFKINNIEKTFLFK